MNRLAVKDSRCYGYANAGSNRRLVILRQTSLRRWLIVLTFRVKYRKYEVAVSLAARRK